MNGGFVFYKSFYDSIKNLDDTIQIEVFKALCEYYFNNNSVELSPVANAIFTLMKPNIDSSIKRYNASVENGKKGGRPPKEKNLEKPSNNLNKTKQKPSENLYIDIDIEKDIEKDIDINIDNNNNNSVSDKKENDVFIENVAIATPPTLNEIISYGLECGVNNDYCEKFFNHYEGVGWVNGNGIKIKKWKSIFNGWIKKDKEKEGKKTNNLNFL